MSPPKLHSARNHEEARGAICCVCAKKVGTNGIKVISEKYADLVRKYIFSDYSVKTSCHPTAICGSCRQTLTSFEKVIFMTVNKDPSLKSCILFL